MEVFQAVNPAWRPAGPVTALPVSDTVLVNGGPDSLLQLAGQGVVTGQPAVIAGDPLPVRPALWAVTDGQRRADNAFSLTSQNMSFTYTATETNPPDDPLGGSGDPPRQLLPVPAAGHQTVAVLSGAAQVTASSYGYWLAQEPQYDPVNAFDGNPATAWAEASPYTPVGQWIQVSFDHTLDLPATIGIQLLVDHPSRSLASQVQVSTAAGSVTTNLAGTGATQALRVRPGPTSWLRITITGASNVVGRRPRRRVHRRAHPRRDGDPLPAAGRRPRGHRGGVDRLLLPAAGRLTAAAAGAAGQRGARADLPGAGRAAGQHDRRGGGHAGRGARSPHQQPGAGQQVHLPGDRELNLGLAAAVRPGQPVRLRQRALDRQPGRSESAAPGDLAGHADDQRAGAQPGTRRGHVPGERGSSQPAGHPAGQRGPGRRRAPGPAAPHQSAVRDLPGPAARRDRRGGQAGQLPIGLSKLTIPGLAGLRVAKPSGQATFLLACGQGPAISVDGKSYPTAVSGTVADLIQSLPVQVRLCAPGGQLALSAGRHWLLATPSSVFVVTDLDLRTAPGDGGQFG